MAIEYAGGTIVKTTLDGTNAVNWLTQLQAAMVSAGWTSATLGTNDYNLTSAKTPDGLQMKVRIRPSVSTAGLTQFYARDMDNLDLGGAEMYIGAGITYDCLVTRYTVWLWVQGITGSLPSGAVLGYGTSIATGVPFLPDPVKPLTVNGATNTSPIQITTIEDHGLLTGNTVFLAGVGGNTAANGSWVITSTGLKTFTLDSSVGNGAYTSGGVVGTTSRISKAFYFNNSAGTGALVTNGWRTDPFQTKSTSGISSYSGFVANAYSTYTTGLNGTIIQPATYPWRNSRSVIVEPYVSGLSATQFQVYGAVVIRGTPVPPIDTIFTMDGHNWVIYGVGGTSSALAIAIN